MTEPITSGTCLGKGWASKHTTVLTWHWKGVKVGPILEFSLISQELFIILISLYVPTEIEANKIW